jgi:hypothetical protein
MTQVVSPFGQRQSMSSDSQKEVKPIEESYRGVETR